MTPLTHQIPDYDHSFKMCKPTKDSFKFIKDWRADTKNISVRIATILKLAILILFAFSSVTLADFKAASSAYQQKDFVKAFSTFGQLAEDGDPKSQTILAMMYRYGEGTSIDLEKAFYWYLEAGMQKFPPAQYTVGIMLTDGIGVSADPEAAKEWLALAKASGYTGVKEKHFPTIDSKGAQNTEIPKWSRNWNLRLPNTIRYPQLIENTDPKKIYKTQFGAMSNLTRAKNLWEQIFDNNEFLLKGMKPSYQTEKTGQKLLWKVRSGGFTSKFSADNFCKRFRENLANKTGCIAVRE